MSRRKEPAWQKPQTDDGVFLSAGKEGIPFLYRYQKFQLEKTRKARPSDPEILEGILKSHKVYCANPLSFNDPWDCKPCLNLDALEDPDVRRNTALFLIANQKNGPQGDPIDQALLNHRSALKKVVTGFTECLVEFIAERWAICCLSADPCSTLMWSHYSDNHKGICFQFAVNNTKFLAAMKVKYRKHYPKLVLSDEQFRYQMLLIKAEAWAYEQEYRLICPTSAEATDIKDSQLILDNKYLDIGSTALKAVILGCQIDQNATDVIRSLINEHSSSVKIRRAVRSGHDYRLQLEDI